MHTARWSLTSLFVGYLLVAQSFAAPPDEDDEEFRPGLVAEYRAGERVATRIDPDVAFAWDEAAPDARVSAERFEATWRGFLLVRQEAQHRLHAFVQGDVSVELDGRRVLRGSAKQPQWISGDQFASAFGERPLVVTFRKTEKTAQLKLFWSSDMFGLEPLPPELLFHEQTPAEVTLIERGRRQFAAFRCGRCHVREGDSLAPAAPSLQRVTAGMTGEQIAKRLAPALNSPDATGLDRRMPHFRLNEEQARHLAAFLVKQSESTKLDEAKTIKPKTPKEGEVVVAPQRRGELLLRTVGCLACHRVGELGNSNDLPFAGPDLTHVDSRRSASWLTTWLADPQRLNADHRMPVFALTEEERQLIVMALKPNGDGAVIRQGPLRLKPGIVGSKRDLANEKPDEETKESPVDAGRRLFVEHRCAACHRATDPKLAEFAKPKSDLSRPTDWSQGCLDEQWVNDNQQHPIYPKGLDRAAIRAFLASRWDRSLSPESQFVRGTRLLEEKNCFACHPRHRGIGLGQTAKVVAAADKDLNGQAPALVPPSLNSVGDKLLDEALSIAVRGERQPIRMPWLRVRMPRFKHSPDEMAMLTRYLVEHDRIPAETGGQGEKTTTTVSPDPRVSSSPSAEAHLAGQALTGVRGWSCIACHKIGDYEPKQVALGARGSDLKMLGKHLRPEFFFRWIASPLRVIPGVEMPQYNRPVAGVLDGNLSRQHAALWQALNDPNFQPPTNPANVEQLWAVNPGERPRIIRDVFQLPKELGGGTVPRSFAVGLSNGHSFLFDLDTVSLRQWTIGDFARQQTVGKRWLWELAGLNLRVGFTAQSDIALRKIDDPDGKLILPVIDRDVSPRLVRYSTNDKFREAISDHFAITLNDIFELEVPFRVDGEIRWINIQQRFSIDDGDRLEGVKFKEHRGWERGVTVTRNDLRGGYELGIARPAGAKRRDVTVYCRRESKPDPLDWFWEADQGWAQAKGDPVADREWAFTRIRDDHVWAHLHLLYATDVSPNRVTLPTKAAIPSGIEKVRSVPGFDGQQLPIDSSIMPTAMAWRNDGTLGFTTLKGHVWLARDSNQDGVEDQLTLFEEGLAAPYGIAWTKYGWLVAHKPELLWLRDEVSELNRTLESIEKPHPDFVKSIEAHKRKANPNGLLARSVLASGWGYVDDYHDWTCSVVSDSKGRMFFGLGSDYTDKNRPAAKSKWRGKVLRSDPNRSQEDSTSPALTPIGHAFRYPTGIAINERDEVFVSDQQGVQNCFNEINYLVGGAHYGVPSTHEEDKDAPETKAAIQIPHPWTRSVNGLCFLTGNEGYPDLKGHGIGCEYNGRFLIRFTTQRVGDVMQGAVYPFSLTDDELVRGLDRSGPPLGATNAIEVSGGKPAAPRQKTVPNFEGPLCCGVSPKGELYIGSIADSGWAGGQNTGSIVKLKGNGERPNGIREIRATRDGFDIDFFAPVDRARATHPEHYSISGYTRVWGGAYATPDSDRHRCKVVSVELTEDGKSAKLKVDSRKTPNYVYDISCREVADPDKPLFPAYGFFTLHKIPTDDRLQ